MPWVEQLPSGNYRAMYRLPNGAKRSAGTFTHKRAAKDAAIAAEGEGKRPGALDPRSGLITWGDWAPIWLKSRIVESNTLKHEGSMIDCHILPRWGEVPLAEIRRHDVQAWASELLTTNRGTDDKPRYLKPTTARRVVSVLASSLTAAEDAELITGNPAARIKLPTYKGDRLLWLTPEQYAALRAELPTEHDLAIADHLLSTGSRWGEMAGLHIHRYNVEGGALDIADVLDGKNIKPYPKGRNKRAVPLLPWAVESVTIPKPMPCKLHHTEKHGCPSGLMFTNPDGTPLDNRNWSQRVLAPAVKAAGLADLRDEKGNGITTYTFRHTYASWLVQNGTPLERVQQLLGHASIVTTQIYAHLKPPKLADVHAALSDPRDALRADVSNVIQFPSRPGA